MAELECLQTNRGIIPDTLIVYLIGDGQLEGKYMVKTWTSLLAEIFHPGSPKLIMGQQDSREIEGGRSR